MGRVGGSKITTSQFFLVDKSTKCKKVTAGANFSNVSQLVLVCEFQQVKKCLLYCVYFFI